MAFKMKGHSLPGPHQRKSPAKQATPDVEGEKKVMDKRTKTIESHRKNAPKNVNTQEQADQLNQMDADNVAAYNTSSDSIQNVHNLYRADIEKQNAVIDSTNTANKAAYDKYMKSIKKKKKSAAKSHVPEHDSYERMQGFGEKDYEKNLADEKKADTAEHDKGVLADNAARNAHEKKKAANAANKKKNNSPAKQGYRPTRDKDGKTIDYTDPEVLRKEKEGNQRIIDSRKDLNPNSFKRDPRDVRPSDKNKPSRSKGGAIRSTPKELAERKKNLKNSPAKQGLRDPKKDYTDPKVLQEEKEGNQRIHDIREGKYDRDKKRREMIKNKKKKELVRPPKKKSPGKWAQFIPLALSAISSMKKDKEE